jgi:hypothetical protein
MQRPSRTTQLRKLPCPRRRLSLSRPDPAQYLRAPDPGYLRVDTVHQGDRDGVKGVYHLNAVDEVTQWQVVGAAARISEAHLIRRAGRAATVEKHR